jgi:hypothetical protein
VKTCKKCGGPLPVHKGRHRPRVFCERCRPPRRQGQEGQAPDPMAVGVVLAGAFGSAGVLDAGPASLAVVTEAKLRAAGRRDEPEGVLVLNLARSIDAGGHSGASLASLSREYSRALAAALPSVDAAAEDDGVDWQVG